MNTTSTNTEGGAYVGGDAQAGRDFVGRDQIVFNITWQSAPFTLQEPDLARLRADYLAYIREAYQFLDFKGLPQVEKIAQQLALDAVYVPLRARPDAPEGETWLRVAGRFLAKEEMLEAPEALLAHEAPSVPVLADEAIAVAPALVILGDPGAGKSTLLKVLALSLARQTEGPLPILIPLNAYAAALAKEELSLHAFLARYFATRQQCLSNLGPLFDAALAAGQAVILLDGLDEVQDKRAFLVRLVQDFAAECIPAPGPGVEPVPGNRLVVTSRIVGYREAPLDGARWRRYTLVDWGREEITRFVERWTWAFEVGVHGESDVARKAATQEAQGLLDAVLANPGIERLASNPLLLTILALIKRQGVSLPQRRVQLYELYLQTLINAWNKARSLDKRSVGPEMDYLETVQVLAPLGLWLRQTNPTAGLVSRAAIEDWLADYYQEEWGEKRGPARQRGREFLRGVRQYSNLLVERGWEQYGFLHLTFEEMLAAKGIAALEQLGVQEAVNVILRYLDDPAWHETILLAIGALGLVAQRPVAAGAVLCELCAAAPDAEKQGRAIVLAGKALLDVGEVGVGRKAAAQVKQKLVAVMQAAAQPARTRREAGLLLGNLGWPLDDLDAFVEIPAGEFLYGDDKKPREIPYRYWIGKYPVTNAQFDRFVDDGGYERQPLWSADGWAWRTGTYDSKAPEAYRGWLSGRPPEKRNLPYFWQDDKWNNALFPVVGVSWFEADAYCRWLEKKMQDAGGTIVAWQENTLVPCVLPPASLRVRLPREEEWERAARGPDGREYPWGDVFDLTRLNCADFWAGRELGENEWIDYYRSNQDAMATTVVCTYPAGMSAAEVWDMSGNVWEWTGSSWDKDNLVLRGGAWINNQRLARCACRSGLVPDGFDVDVGFRVVLSLGDSGS